MVDLSKLNNLATQVRERTSAARSSRSAGSRWFEIQNKANVAEVYIYDEIGEYGITAAEFVNELKSVKASQIDLHLRCKGGEVFDALAIYESLRQHPANVTTYIDSLAASAASFIALAGDKVVMAKNARMMIHDAAVGGIIAMGNAADLRQAAKDTEALADLLDDMSDNIASIYQEKAGGTIDHWRDLMRAETWFSAEDALRSKLVDEIAGKQEVKNTTTASVVEDREEELDLDMEEFRRMMQEAFQ
jgi:ATP-dependent protease ClpP protease subunit